MHDGDWPILRLVTSTKRDWTAELLLQVYLASILHLGPSTYKTTIAMELDRTPKFPGTFSQRSQEEYLSHVSNSFTSQSKMRSYH